MAHQHNQAIQCHFTLVVGSRWKIQDKRQTKNTDNTQLNTTQKKQTTQNTAKQN